MRRAVMGSPINQPCVTLNLRFKICSNFHIRDFERTIAVSLEYVSQENGRKTITRPAITPAKHMQTLLIYWL